MQNQQEPINSQWTILKLLAWTTSYFNSHNIENPRASAEILLSHVLKAERIDLYLRYDQPLSAKELSQFKALIQRRRNYEPVAYIVGMKAFWSLEIEVNRDVLIPRPESERLVEAALSLLPADGAVSKRVLELGTGSGAIVLAIASERPDHLFFASDRSAKALEVARKNARRNGLDKKVCFFAGTWFDALKQNAQPFDMIVSNPPYVPTGDISGLQPDIHRYEPLLALDGGEDGLSAITHLIAFGHRYLKPGGYLMLEIGHDQARSVRQVIDQSGFYVEIVFEKDYGGYDRVVRMKKK